MKILWFANTPCSAIEKLNMKGMRGGWLVSLEQELKQYDEIELHVAFYYGLAMEPFTYNGICYHPLHRKNTGSKRGRYINKLLCKTDNDTNEVNQLSAVVRLVAPNLIHVHGTEENFGLIQAHTNIPVVISIQGLMNAIAQKFYAGISSADAARSESMMQKISFKSASYLFKGLQKAARREQVILQQAKYIVGRTDFDKRITRVLAPASTYFISNEILRSAFYKTVWNKPVGNIIKIVTVTSDGTYKGFETIVAIARILAKQEGFTFEWIVAGLDEHTGIVETVKKLMNVDFKSLHIQLVGFKSHEEIANILSTANVYCQVSHIENSPNSLCEAMLLGMPIVATFAGGTSSMLQNGSEGILVQDGDALALAGAILELSNNNEVAAELGYTARKIALRRHNKKTIAQDLISTYKTILNNHH